MKTRPGVAVDFDGVIAATGYTKSVWVMRELELVIEPANASRSDLVQLIGVANYDRMQRAVGYADTLEAEPLPLALSCLKEMSEHQSVFVITSRPEQKIIWVLAWLRKYGLDRVIGDVIGAHDESKIQVSRRLKCWALIDNDFRHLISSGAEATTRFWFCGESPDPLIYGKAMSAGVQPVRSWQELWELGYPITGRNV